MTTMQVIDIVDGTSVDGPGLRTSIYFAGCPHHCFGCHNPHTWDYNAGQEMTIDKIMERIIENDFNVTFSGGDPLAQIDSLIILAKKIKDIGKTIWCYTGYRYEEIISNKSLSKILPYIDVIVDGKFIIKLKEPGLLFRGSSNQRLIDVRQSTTDNPVLWKH